MTSKPSSYSKNTFTNIASSVTILIEQLFSFVVLKIKNGDLSSFKFLFCLYVLLPVFSGKILSISWLLRNTDKRFLMMLLMLGSNGLYCVIKLHEAEKLLLFLGPLASSLEVSLTSENSFLNLLVYNL